MSGPPYWYKDAILYEVHVRGFADSTGSGVGDFAGLTGKLDYLQDLGVIALWLLPFYPSPLKDDGYDIADYTAFHAAAASALAGRESGRGVRPQDREVLTPWARVWTLWASAAFVRGYWAAAEGSALAPRREDFALLLNLFLREHAVRELGRELRERPGEAPAALADFPQLLESLE